MEPFWNPTMTFMVCLLFVSLGLLFWSVRDKKGETLQPIKRKTRDISNLGYSPEPGDEFEGGIRYNVEPGEE